ncbi:hypothetical protein [Nocardia sp. NPDC020380]|uniref:hypothetical protein n=1 Tax=Nocardia sp. NPDC020380 TaxID=3364309 RepID=UPI00379F24FD
MNSTNQAGQFPTGGSPSFTDMSELSGGSVTFGYEQQDVAERPEAVAHNKTERRGPIGWWNRHKMLTTGVGLAVAANLAFVPLIQNAALVVLGHVL